MPLLLAGLSVGLWACKYSAPTSAAAQREKGVAPKTAAQVEAAKETLKLGWDPKTGKGEVIHRLSNGDLLRTCFHCGYEGYTGGLVMGNFNGSGYALYPKTPRRGYRSINVFCAQDESIWDHNEKVEYTYGWSENYGKGADGKPLNYVRGRIIESGPARLILQSENAGGCYKVTKVATTRRGVRWWIIATRVTNTCDHDVHFDFFTGDDPWIGTYRSSDGDVGWTSRGLVRTEQAFGKGLFTAGGFYDLGNRALGQKEGSFSNQANFFQLDPASPLPDLALFANSFAHTVDDLKPGRPLDNKSLSALNLGWRELTLSPGQGFTTAMALGLAITTEPGATPRPPEITPQDWSVWRRYLKEGNPASGKEAVEFAAERVELEITKDQMTVKGTYYLRNPGPALAAVNIKYPILVAPDRPAPDIMIFDGEEVQVHRVPGKPAEGRFTRQVPPRGLARFHIQYTQRHTGRQAVYMVTSALGWPGPISRAVFVIRHPASLGRVKLAYPAVQVSQVGKVIEHVIVQQPFVPHREMSVRW